MVSWAFLLRQIHWTFDKYPFERETFIGAYLTTEARPYTQVEIRGLTICETKADSCVYDLDWFLDNT